MKRAIGLLLIVIVCISSCSREEHPTAEMPQSTREDPTILEVRAIISDMKRAAKIIVHQVDDMANVDEFALKNDKSISELLDTLLRGQPIQQQTFGFHGLDLDFVIPGKSKIRLSFVHPDRVRVGGIELQLKDKGFLRAVEEYIQKTPRQPPTG
jgi:hypothetical protein